MATRGANPEPFSKFAEFVAKIKAEHVGHDLAGNSENYVPLTALRDYWTSSRISKVLRAFSDRLDIHIPTIQSHYLRIFSTLVYTHPDTVPSLQHLFISRNLHDGRFPSRRPPAAWPDEKFFSDFHKQIAPNQWQFFPLLFTPDQLQDHHIDDECILPIDSIIEIESGSAAVIEHFDIHPDYNLLEGQKPSLKHTFVFKKYHNKSYEEYYENELRALRRLNTHPSPNIVKFYGSIRQHGQYALILEFADGGDLGKLFGAHPPPSTVEDVVLFWKSLFQVFTGLDRIHQLMQWNADEVIKGIHEDVRPENILIMKGASDSPYDFTPKIADFALYSRVRTARSKSSGSMGLDHYGGQRFSSPECCHHIAQRQKGVNVITTSADIFSIGAVLSHTAAWVIGGRKEQTNYFQSRKSYHEKNLPRFKGSAYVGCFHNGIEPLPLIAQHHRVFVQRCKPLDDVTPKVLTLVDNCMLLDAPRARLRAKVILEKFEQFMDSRYITAPPTPPSPSLSPSLSRDAPPTASASDVSDTAVQSPFWSETGHTPSTLDGLSPPLMTPAEPVTPGDDLGHACRAPPPAPTPPHASHVTKTAEPSHSSQDTTSQTTLQHTPPGSSHQPPPAESNDHTSTPRPGPSDIRVPQINEYHSALHQGRSVNPDTAQLVEYLEHNLSGRDQFFFIDDSRSMRADKETIDVGFHALACIAKKLDPNQVELAFASRPSKVYRERRTKRLRDLVKRCQYKGEGHLMEDRLGELVNKEIIPKLPYKMLGVNVNLWARKKVSVYVFTDGDWGDARESRDACGVERPVRGLIEELKKRRLDRTQVSLHFVRFGDKENGRLHLERLDECGQADGWDIVDVKHIRTGVKGMILGPLTRSNDDILGG